MSRRVFTGEERAGRQKFAARFSLVLCVLMGVAAADAAPPLERGDLLEGEYVLLQQGKSVGWENASWRADSSSDGWLLQSDGEFVLGPITISFEQETRYTADGVPMSYEMRALVGADTQIVRLRTTADSVYMEARVEGRWHDRAVSRPEPFVVTDNLLTSQLQMVLWTHGRGASQLVHAAVPQRLALLPATLAKKGEFAPERQDADRGQPIPVSVPAEAVDFRMGPVTQVLAVAREENRLLQISIASQGVRFELRKLSRSSRGGSKELLYEGTGHRAPEPSGFRETETSFLSDGFTFTGTLCLPDGGGPFPTALMLQGSGPQDRDETIGPNAPFRDLAHGLAQHGVATYRFDKRTYLYPGEIDPQTVTLDEETIRDAETALVHLAGLQEVEAGALFVLGHSLGGTAALLLDPPPDGIRGVVLMATMGRPFTDVLHSQISYLADLGRSEGRMTPAEESRTEETLRAIDDLAAGRLSDDEMVLGMPVSYIEDLDRRDVVQGAAFLGAPLLILQGGQDYQVTEEDARLLEQRFRDAALPDVIVEIYPELGHLFIPVEGRPSPEHYQTAGSVSPDVVDRIAAWVHERAGSHR